ncbi:hypothetical protein [Chitinasiproducens palmae]|uniref:Uncharacterized protein n=1 Tax=Chitinasiproducens palmae TaxID=1770053 RepID=A0A1H2PQY7_9BURK|nr:hypothetical protein [Chitinasiproducens palmae]SDV49236.1 hypothetical protein SAMN05216551_107172 [Chitinasiproducens palmae]
MIDHIQLAAVLFVCAILTFVGASLPRQGATFIAALFTICAFSALFFQVQQ